jgi:hypothetical protein
VGDKEGLSTLSGVKGNPITELARHPNSFWIHPQLFSTVSGPQTIRAAEMALLVLLSIREKGLEEGEHPTEDEIGIYNLYSSSCGLWRRNGHQTWSHYR